MPIEHFRQTDETLPDSPERCFSRIKMGELFLDGGSDVLLLVERS
jgi:hypothetical protein